MISAKVCVESHVAYHSLEGRPQIIGSFITLPRANCVASTAAISRPGRLFIYVLDTITCVNDADICVNDADLRPGRQC